MSLVLSRDGLLDIFLQFFVLAGFGALVVDRDQMRARLAGLIADGADLTGGVPTLGPAAVAAASAGVMLGPRLRGEVDGAVVLRPLRRSCRWCWDRGALKSAGVRRPWRTPAADRLCRRSARWCIVPMRDLPAVLPRLVHRRERLEPALGRHPRAVNPRSTSSGRCRPVQLGAGCRGRSARSAPTPTTPTSSTRASTAATLRVQSVELAGPRPAGQLLLPRQPTGCGSSSCSREVLLIGTPLMWWAFVPMLLWLAWHWFTTRDWRAVGRLGGVRWPAGWSGSRTSSGRCSSSTWPRSSRS